MIEFIVFFVVLVGVICLPLALMGCAIELYDKFKAARQEKKNRITFRQVEKATRQAMERTAASLYIASIKMPDNKTGVIIKEVSNR